MPRTHRIPWAHLLALLLPCAIIAFLGYRWLELEREAKGRRGREAAAAAAAQLRTAALDHVTQVMRQAAPQWLDRRGAAAPFAPAPDLPPLLSGAWLASPAGVIVFPAYDARLQQAIRDYEAATRRPEWQSIATLLDSQEKRGETAGAIRTLTGYLALRPPLPLRAWTLLNLGRLSLSAGDRSRAHAFAKKLIECCPGARDEFGTALAMYAARQLSLSGMPAPAVAETLRPLLQQGWIGHPRDLPEITGVVPSLRAAAEQQARRIQAAGDAARRAPTILPAALSADMATLFSSGSAEQLAAAVRAGDAILVATIEISRLSAWVAARSATTNFSATAVTGREGFELVLHPSGTDATAQQSRETLFAAALAAALLLTLLLGFLAARDYSRERQLAALRSSFVAGVTHELKTPLTSIRLLAETVRLGRSRTAAANEQILDTIVSESERLTRLLDNVLNFSRIERGVREYRPQEVPLVETVSDAVTRFRSVLDQEGFTLTQQLDCHSDTRVCVDPDAFTESVLNLLANAVKFSGTAREVALAVHQTGGEAEISVSDHGIGIAAADQKRIFDSFYRAPDAARETTGAGLGLALVKHFAEAHGGRVLVRSATGEGSTFSIRLPLRNGTENGQNPDR